MLVGTPDHWHALPMIAAVRGRGRRLRAEADQRGRGRGPGDARRRPQAQARRAGRHAAPQHAAPDRGPRHASSRRASSARSAWSRSTATTTCGPAATRRTRRRPTTSITRCGPARPRCGRTTASMHPRGWRAFMEYGNGIVGDMCIHMFDMVRWMLDLGWPKRISSTGGILVDRRQQGEHLRHADGHVRLRRPARRLAAPHLGRAARPEVSLGRDVLRRQGHAEGQRQRATTSLPLGNGAADASATCTYEFEQVSRGQDREGPGAARRPGDPRPHAATSWRPSPARGKPVADIEQGHISTASCILANLSMKLGRSLAWDPEAGCIRRRRGQRPAGPAVSRAVGAPEGVTERSSSGGHGPPDEDVSPATCNRDITSHGPPDAVVPPEPVRPPRDRADRQSGRTS